MKIRTGFVTNSSSSSFLIINISNSDKTLGDLAREVAEIFDLEQYASGEYSKESFVESAEALNVHFSPGQKKIIEFGDHRADDGEASVIFHNLMSANEGMEHVNRLLLELTGKIPDDPKFTNRVLDMSPSFEWHFHRNNH